jgi:hypothetical protein
MKLHRLFPAFALFAFTIPVCGQAQPLSEVDSLLNAASKALDHWQQLAPDIHCEDATQPQFRDACKINVLAMGERVQEAKAEIVRYRQLTGPQVVDLFDAYQSFRRVLEITENMICAPDAYGERNRRVFAEAYNAFVKVNGWFGGTVRDSIRRAARCPDHAHT